MSYALTIVAGFVAGVAVSVWRLRGSMSLRQALTVVIKGGGGPGPRL